MQLRTPYLKAGVIRLKLFESAISLEHYGIEGQNLYPVNLIILNLYKKFGSHVTQNGCHKWQNTKCAWPTLFLYPCGGAVLVQLLYHEFSLQGFLKNCSLPELSKNFLLKHTTKISLSGEPK